MKYTLFKQYRDTILTLPASASGPDERLLMDRQGSLSIYYAPFEYVNPQARVVVVGITPGLVQMLNALAEAQRQLRKGIDDETALRLAKQIGAFSGTMRNNLVELLDHVRLHQWLGIASTRLLFGSDTHLFQPASVLCYPVFVDGKNYSGNPNMLKNAMLQRYLLTYFGEVARQLSEAVFIPVGDKPAEALGFLADKGIIDHRRILQGLPHPSGANAERIAYFLGKKAKKDLSEKTDPSKLDQAKAELISRIRMLGKIVDE